MKGSSLEVSNYRPISLLSNIGKIYEKMMHSRDTSFLTFTINYTADNLALENPALQRIL